MWRMKEFNYPLPPQHKTILYISDNTSKRYLQMTVILWNTTKMTIGLELLLSSIVHDIILRNNNTTYLKTRICL